MSKEAHELIQALTLERAGICDGDGAWHGSDPIHGMIQNLVEFDRVRDTGQGEPWITDDDSPF